MCAIFMDVDVKNQCLKNGKHLPIDSEDQWEVVKQQFFRSR